jgi:S-adenosylmethionine hydrolase
MSTSIITLTTDFGYPDGFVGTMKGVILGMTPQVQLVDISHSVAPQNVFEGAHILGRAFPFFPAGTVHVAVVDPGVGTNRRPLAAKIGGQFFVGPDNGLFTIPLEHAEKTGDHFQFVHLNNPEYWLANVSHTFHGRDIFAPIAAHLVMGIALEQLGDAIFNPIRLTLSAPTKGKDAWQAHVTYIDHFGNLATDLSAEILADSKIRSVEILSHTIKGVVSSYGEGLEGELIALIDSEGFLEIARVNGNAASTLGAKSGDNLTVKVNPA